jgi:hypothetical protein
MLEIGLGRAGLGKLGNSEGHLSGRLDALDPRLELSIANSRKSMLIIPRLNPAVFLACLLNSDIFCM